MSELDYIGANELVFNNDIQGGIHSGGFSVNSIMLKAGMSPIMTINTGQSGGDFNKVSDLFNDLVIPNWALSYNSRLVGGKYKEVEHKDVNSDTDTDTDEDVIDDGLHDKLLELVKEDTIKFKEKKKLTKKNNKKSLRKTKKNK